MVRNRTTRTDLFAEAIDGALAAFEAVGIEAASVEIDPRTRPGGRGADLPDPDGLLELSVDDRVFEMAVEAVSYCTGEAAHRLIARVGPVAGTPWLLVADKITAEARRILTDAGWSWLDRRGQLHLSGPGVRIDQRVPPGERATASSVAPAIAGRSGITVAYWLCAHPGERLSPNGQKSELCLAPSTISTTVRRLAEAGLVDENGAAVVPDLFWELATVWRSERTWLVDPPQPEGHVPSDPQSPSWRITGTAAAAAYGAPLTTAGRGPLDLYVSGPVEISIATRRYGAAHPGAGAAAIAVPPTSLVNERHEDERAPMVDGWPAAPLVAVALDVAQDAGRGREILEDWRAGDGIWH
jgi:hypothetical protein